MVTELTPVGVSETKQRLMNWWKLVFLMAEAISISLLFLARQFLIITHLMKQHGAAVD